MVNSCIRKTATYAVVIATAILGFASLATFAAFLWTGSLGILGLRFSESGTLIWDAGLCFIFFLQHTGMLRRPFRVRLQKWLPAYWSGVVYTIASAAGLFLLVGAWQRSSIELYAAEGGERWFFAALLLLALLGFVWGARSLERFDAFGIELFLSGIRGSATPQSALTIRGPYRLIRHPFYTFGIVALWAGPVLSLDRAVLNVLFTVWIVVGANLEERDLVSAFGESYRHYQAVVPMFVPTFRPSRHIAHHRA